MSRITAKNLTVRRGGRAIVDGVDLQLDGGGLIALIGANGAGKSTLLACLAGLIAPDEGAVELDGKSLGAWKAADLARRRAFLPQSPRCEWPISVERLVALGLTPTLPAFGGLPVEMAAKVERALAEHDLLARRDQPATTLSGGELARAMLARALVGKPDVLIVDEPTTGLDPRHAIDAVRRLKAQASDGRLVVTSIHDLTLAARHADAVIALKDGRVIAQGPMRQTLTPGLLTEVFDVRAQISDTAEGPLVDLLSSGPAA